MREIDHERLFERDLPRIHWGSGGVPEGKDFTCGDDRESGEKIQSLNPVFFTDQELADAFAAVHPEVQVKVVQEKLNLSNRAVDDLKKRPIEISNLSRTLKPYHPVKGERIEDSLFNDPPKFYNPENK